MRVRLHRGHIVLSVLMSVAALERTVVLVRHGAVNRAAANVPANAMYGGDIDVPLSRRGEAEARAAALYVAKQWPEKIQSVWTSPLIRAKFGAQLVADAAGIQSVQTREAFREIARGGWLRKTPEEIDVLTPGGMSAFLSDIEYRPPNAESIKDVRDRSLAALTQEILPSLEPGKVAVLVSHLYVTRALLSFALPGVPIPEIDVPTASIASLTFKDGIEIPIVTSRGVKPDLQPEDKAALEAAGSFTADAES